MGDGDTRIIMKVDKYAERKVKHTYILTYIRLATAKKKPSGSGAK